jgi:S-adenosylmethionine-diacylglycerol 3-amino-3-carboxypropyl transferase
MTDLSVELSARKSRPIRTAVYQNRAASRAGISERLFALVFSGLVYPQIWEDPEVDMEAMQLGEGHRLVTIASGGCNLLAYLSRSPASVDAVDLNRAHVALNRLKLAAFRHLPSHQDVFRFFGEPGNRHNGAAYDHFIAPNLDDETRRYWERRTLRGRRRISAFERNFYRTGALGFFIGLGHRAARLYGVDPAAIMATRTQREQRRFFEEELAPIFRKRLVRWSTSLKSSLFALGIPPAQYDALVGDEGEMARVLSMRLEKLACHFALRDNYFAWQAFARRYPKPGEAALPAYLDEANYPAIRANVDRVEIHHRNIVDLLETKPDGSVDRFVLLDAQDWMTDLQLNALWSEITRTAAQDARVIFRTAAEPTLLPGRVAGDTLGRWEYREAESHDYTRRDRSAIYGGFHLYVKKLS